MAPTGWFHALASNAMALRSSVDNTSDGVISSSSVAAPCNMKVTALERYIVKGLSSDALDSVQLTTSNRFPNDRQYALLQRKHQTKWKGTWLHKDHFLCAFTHPELLAQFQTKVVMVRGDSQHEGDSDDGGIVLELYNRSSGELLLPHPLHMNMENDRQTLARFLSEKSGQDVVCTTSRDGQFQFGNTSSGTKHGDPNARTIHIVFQSTVDALQDKVGVPINPTRFRPNIVLQGQAIPPFEEFQWIGQTIASEASSLQLKIISKTVRCNGVSVDPLDPQTVLDIPKLLVEHFPQHGPYLGVYCVVKKPGRLTVGDSFRLLN